MKSATETELKYWLSKHSYDRLREALAPCLLHTRTFTNWYLDSREASLRKARCGLRLRIDAQSQKARITFKAPSTRGSRSVRGLQVHQEWEAAVSASTAQELLTQGASLRLLETHAVVRALAQCFPRLSLSRIRPLFSMETTRSTFRVGREIWELDHFVIAGRNYYELEIETDRVEAVERAVRRIFQRLRLRVRASRSSKLGRAWKAHLRRL